MGSGWIKIHRSLLDWEWYDDPFTLKLLIHLNLIVNHKDKKWKGVHIKAGQIVTSILILSERLGVTPKTIRVHLDRLINSGEIVKLGANKYTIITLVKWEQMQYEDELGANNLPNKLPNKLPTTKEGKEEKKNNISFPNLISFINSTLGKNYKVINSTVKSKYNARIKDGFTKDDILNAILTASNDSYHKENNYKYLTPEYFSREKSLNLHSVKVIKKSTYTKNPYE